MSFEIDLPKILETYYEEYKRPLKYIDPRNVSKTSDTYLVNEHNQTVNFYNAVKKYYSECEVVAWFELSIGKNLPKKEGGRESTNAIDGIVYIPELDTLFIIESKGLRSSSKFLAIFNDLKRTIGKERVVNPNDYIMQMKKPSKVYAITLADIWGEKADETTDGWGIDFKKSKLTSRAECSKKYKDYIDEIDPKGQLYSSDSFEIGGNPYRLLAMVYEMNEEQIDTYTFKDDIKTAE